MKDYIQNELKKEDYLVVSEYFFNDNKSMALKNKYVIYSIYSDEEKIKDYLKKDNNFLIKQEDELLKMIDELKKINCAQGKKTILTQDVKQIIEKYKNILKLMDNKLFKTFNLKNKTMQKNNFDSKLEMENINCKMRISVLDSIRKLSEIKSLSLEKIKEKIQNDICRNDKNMKCENIAEDILIYNPQKVIIHLVNSIKEYINEILKIHTNKETETFFYRGHADIKWKLTPSIYRNHWIKKEDVLFRETIVRNPNEFRNSNSTFEKLTKMQHYELPTRLLDVSTNPLVALFFACINSENSNGEVFVFKAKNEEIKYYDSDTVSVISNLSKVNSEFNLKLLPTARKQFNEKDEVKKLVHQIREEKTYFEHSIIPKDLCKTIFVKPKLDNERIIRQSGAFILFGIKDDKYSPAELSNTYKVGTKTHKFIIPSNKKLIIINELKLFGISYSSLFPELDKTSIQLKKEYLGT
ncbi:FRG domain-containing protein [Clostridium estertheticum]|uniref:FRG domain-containing protein n=1 Tax=Clostridium estertheticum TaxID=238834 RepID=UPI001C7DFB3F|nr:FRG domain-containing protein [Clostridium estertheticum]MBX4268448.1 FRG domain-containing protein [Clostridium estertheticum]WLC81492.1 FRG domain-containing protein [Clostridium estertheticum]